MTVIKKGCYILIVFIFTTLSFWGCDSIPGDVVDSPYVDESIATIDVPSQVYWSADDSSFVVSISLENPVNIDSINVRVVNKAGVNEIGRYFSLADEGENGDETAGDGIYSGEPYMQSSMAKGNYRIEYFKYSKDGAVQKLASISFAFDPNQQNFPPVISNLAMPVSIERGVEFIIHITASDPNGLANLSGVVFTLKRPDGSISMNGNTQYFLMYDNGDTAGSGDDVRGDGIFSLKNSFGPTASLGSWTFEFRAIDKAGAISNIITNSMVVQ